MKTTLQKNIFYSVLILAAAIVFGCEEEKDPNQKPLVKIISPENGAIFYSGDSVLVIVNSNDLDGEILDVSIYDNNELQSSFSEPPYEYMWHITDDDVAEHTIKAIATDDQQEETTAEITFTIKGSLPEAYFSTDYQKVFVGKSIQFTDSTTFNPNSWLWDFGDGNTSTEQNPLYSFSEPGIYKVLLTTSNAFGTDTASHKISVVDTIVTDYDGNKYKVVKIGNQYWMGKNLKTTHYADGTPLVDGTGAGAIRDDYTKYYFAYDDDESNVDIYGRLYSWTAVMYDEPSSNENPSGVQGVCPDGWHVPSQLEWEELFNHLGGTEIAGGKLKTAGYDYWMYPNTAATNESGFNGLPAGVRLYTRYNYKQERGYYTSSTKSSLLYYISLEFDESNVIITSSGISSIGQSIRCIKDI